MQNRVHNTDKNMQNIKENDFKDFVKKRSENEEKTSRFRKVLVWIGSGLCGMIMCSCCCNCCGAYKSPFMTKEDEEDYIKMSPGNRCSVNCLDGCTNTIAACCCFGCCCGACGAFGTSSTTHVLSEMG